MMHTIVFATNNANKVNEIRNQLGESFNIIPLKEAGIDIDIPEPHDTLEANATEKSSTIYKLTNQPCFSEDTGLEIFALNNEPGVRSARYAGEGKDSNDNIDLVLQNMEGIANRKAQFRTVISLQLNGKEHLFEGKCPGTILTERDGEKGFGYDPIFVPDGADVSFAQMTTEEKNIFSHRAKAVKKLIEFLKSI